jgi:peptidoglycan/xylan/chitin deacetylase (PgdA/CDA1 family)
MKLLFQQLSPAGPRARLQVLIFHRVLATPDPLFPEEVDAARFEAICRWLAHWFNVLPLDRAARMLADGTLPARAMVITFDDGYADNHDLALPILARHGLCATFFIATDFLDGGRMWNDTVIESIRRTRCKELDLSDLTEGKLVRVELDDATRRRHAIDLILGHFKYLPVVERQRMVDAVAVLSQAELPDDLMMTAGQVTALRDAGMQIGGHTASHPILAELSDELARDEIVRGKKRLEQIIGQRVTLFAYPNGRPDRDYTARTVALAKEAGFEAAVTTAWGAAGTGSDVFQVPRFTPWDRRRSLFGLRMAKTLWQSRSGFAVATPSHP